MAVYVDNFRCPASVERIKARWSHLTADTVEELQAFARTIGLRPAWFQAHCKYLKCPQRPDGTCRHFHYDVTDRKREAAITAGAKSIDIREFGEITRDRKDLWLAG